MESFHSNWIAVVDDSRATLILLEKLLMEEAMVKKVSVFESPEAFLDDLKQRLLSQKELYDLVLSDIRMGAGSLNGPELLAQMKILGGGVVSIPIVFMTSYPNYDDAVSLIKEGAHDYIPKPDRDLSKFSLIIQRVLRVITIERENLFFRNQYREEYDFHGIIGKSAPIRAVIDIIKRVSDANVRVLITGATGTGKELVARAIHNDGPRKNKKFVAVNCASIPENLLESELFGHVKGSFTSAIRDKVGLFEEANGGTLLLDEIGDMGAALQAKLLRVLQDMIVRPIGSNSDRKVDLSVIASTNKNLREACAQGTFREDLYYRLNTVHIALPSLSERREDIPLLLNHFLKKYVVVYNRELTTLDGDAIRALTSYAWPGNVRELEHAVERAIILSKQRTLTIADFIPLQLSIPEMAPLASLPSLQLTTEMDHERGCERNRGPERDHGNLSISIVECDKFKSLEQIEMAYIEKLLQHFNNDKGKVADALGLSLRTLYRKYKKFNEFNEESLIGDPLEDATL
ncbi:MAG: sigma-54-dependent Fis family transcriptional regulator [Oligoflexia bacterium]|nr:sigma-54-dependent Fis family transcriptional regulator [Oligoflexia bacterium]MBF0365254.1 sigma-54-dependent Fis family transcriptional regulator [Oligoflexia bacterium]